MKEKKARVEDAMHATRAAVEEGIVAGGGVALLRARSALDALKLDEEERAGVNIVRRALEEPLRWIARPSASRASTIALRPAKRTSMEPGSTSPDAWIRRRTASGVSLTEAASGGRRGGAAVVRGGAGIAGAPPRRRQETEQ